MDAATLSAKNQMAFQERMSNTALQRQLADAKAAGLNPVLVGKLGGASTPTGAAGDSSSGTDSEMFKLLESSLAMNGKALSSLTDTLSDFLRGSSSSGSGSLVPGSSAPGSLSNPFDLSFLPSIVNSYGNYTSRSSMTPDQAKQLAESDFRQWVEKHHPEILKGKSSFSGLGSILAPLGVLEDLTGMKTIPALKAYVEYSKSDCAKAVSEKIKDSGLVVGPTGTLSPSTVKANLNTAKKVKSSVSNAWNKFKNTLETKVWGY